MLHQLLLLKRSSSVSSGNKRPKPLLPFPSYLFCSKDKSLQLLSLPSLSVIVLQQKPSAFVALFYYLFLLPCSEDKSL